MKKALAALATAAGVAVAMWSYHHPPFHLPSPILNNPLLFQPPPPNKYIKVIGLGSCIPMVFEGTPNPAYGTTLQGSSNSLANGGGANVLDLYCDAQLPAQAVAFDYAELEYAAPNVAPYVSVAMTAYVDGEGVMADGTVWTEQFAIGDCENGVPTPVHAGYQAISLCQTTGGPQLLSADAGPFQPLAVYGQWRYFSIHFLVSLPNGSSNGQPVLGYRIIVHYEAP